MITTNDINNAKQSVINYMKHIKQLWSLVNLGDDLAELGKINLRKFCVSWVLNIEDTWEECENDHSAK